MIYGQKLDEVSPWEMQLANGATPVFDVDSNFQGFEQSKGSSATYVVEVEDPIIKNIGRIKLSISDKNRS